jgi:NACalpha-BTF3-like transcription factor
MPKTPKAEKRDSSASVDDTDNEHTPDKKMAATARKEAAAIKSLSAYEPEKQLKSAVDTSQIKAAMVKLAQEQQAKAEADRLRQKELAAIKVTAEDIAAIVSEFELDKKSAERFLRESSGDLKQTVVKLLA